MSQNSGFLVINKPSGPTSHDIIDELRKITGIKKIGHAGTLDPFASGILVVAVGRESTKQISRYVKLDKKYVATLRLGATSDTYDRTGRIKKSDFEYPKPGSPDIDKVLKKFIGKQEQIPPMYSAKKVKGRKLYELARKGIEIEREPSRIEIFDIKLLSYERPLLTIAVHCSSGTYIRSLAHDIGQILGYGAYLEELQRTTVGRAKIKESVEVRRLKANNWKKYLFTIK